MTEDELLARIEPVAQLEGHDDRAWHVAWNPARPILATCSADKSVRMYSYRANPNPEDEDSLSLTFSHIATIPTGHAKTVRAIAWSPSGKTLATASFDSNIGIWAQEDDETEDEDGGSPNAQWECMSLLEGHETECKSVAYSSSGNLLASCSRDKTVWIWEVHPDSDFECMGVLMEHSQDVKCVAWHPTEEILASASYDDTIKLYIDDPSEDWFCFTTLTGHASTVWSLAFSPDGQFLASGSEDKTVRIWERVQEHKWECVSVLDGHERSVYSVTWGRGKGAEEGSVGWLASTGGDGKILIWDIRISVYASGGGKSTLTHRVLARLPSAHGVFDVNSIVWCPKEGLEDVFATAGDDGLVRVWKVNSR
ncbi:WD40 repeat-like protein [Sparassis latifolia]|uniref:Probable cytosolic iron-sulfur protein assembly protein 1 n=1 Tax=Sparassis crispa TaxID=139825 RepID=A0A401H3V8_9APHY|nr:Probable cytosolic iron-sulfur protein assembly protein [Sparassis crispa]GBE89125.1 Probable cytosolic iron-sulfur protein assembly protein [Sparassis crispa]